jgi:hypothetical protein
MYKLYLLLILRTIVMPDKFHPFLFLNDSLQSVVATYLDLITLVTLFATARHGLLLNEALEAMALS